MPVFKHPRFLMNLAEDLTRFDRKETPPLKREFLMLVSTP